MQDLQKLHMEWLAWIEAVASGSFTPTAAPPPDDSVSVIGAHHLGVHGGALELCDMYFRMPEVSIDSDLESTETSCRFASIKSKGNDRLARCRD